MKKVAVIEDDMDQARLIAFWLRPYGFESTLFINAELFLEAKHNKQHFDLLLIDWNLPGIDGLSLTKSICSETMRPPIIFLTVKDRVEDIAIALHSGADDFISKPLDKTILVARITALLRRYGLHIDSVMINTNDISLSHKNRTLHFHKQFIRLTCHEYLILERLLNEKIGTIVARDEFVNMIWMNGSMDHDSRALDLKISRLRKKLSAFEKEPFRIRNQYGKGYLLEIPF